MQSQWKSRPTPRCRANRSSCYTEIVVDAQGSKSYFMQMCTNGADIYTPFEWLSAIQNIPRGRVCEGASPLFSSSWKAVYQRPHISTVENLFRSRKENCHCIPLIKSRKKCFDHLQSQVCIILCHTHTPSVLQQTARILIKTFAINESLWHTAHCGETAQRFVHKHSKWNTDAEKHALTHTPTKLNQNVIMTFTKQQWESYSITRLP